MDQRGEVVATCLTGFGICKLNVEFMEMASVATSVGGKHRLSV